jgi:nucleoside-diphosphate-sugar epimerase
MIKNLLENIEPTPLKRIIFLSSTSVYGSSEGVYNESSLVNPETSSAKALHICENLIINSPLPSVIVRLGGLIGEDRNPIFQLQGKAIGNPLGCINFIHQEDAINGISNLVINSRLEGIFNLVSPHHHIIKK